MSGHSKWSTIKHKKGLADAKRGKIFSKLSREISVASRLQGPDPNTNVSLRFIIERARSFNMPNENIERAISRGAGTDQEKLEESFLEAYGPGGSALLIKIITDNKNRSFGELRSLIEKHGGKTAQEGSVAWLFERVGKIIVSVPHGEDPNEYELVAIECGAKETAQTSAGSVQKLIVLTKPEELELVRSRLSQKNLSIESAELSLIPRAATAIAEKEKLQALVDFLDEHDDVQEVFTNILE